MTDEKEHTIKKEFVPPNGDDPETPPQGSHIVSPPAGSLGFVTANATITVTSSATATAISVAPDYKELWLKLGAEFSELDDRVLQGLSDETITWKRAGIPIAEEIAQISYGGSPEMQLDPQKVFKSFADGEKDIRRIKREGSHKRMELVAAVLGGGTIVSLIVLAIKYLV